MDVPMSSEDMQRWLPGTPVLVYSDLAQYKTIDDALGARKQMVFLYLTSKMYGHWVCVFRRGKTVHVFDSLGYVPDDELSFIPEHFRRVSNQQRPHLSYLLDSSPYRIEYNEWALQKDSPKIATCGRHCIVRLAFKSLDCNAYARMLVASGNPDQLVVDVLRK